MQVKWNYFHSNEKWKLVAQIYLLLYDGILAFAENESLCFSHIILVGYMT